LNTLTGEQNFVGLMAEFLDKQIGSFTADGNNYPYRIVYLFYDNLCIYPAERIDLLEIEP
jgi:hypothetical protein